MNYSLLAKKCFVQIKDMSLIHCIESSKNTINIPSLLLYMGCFKEAGKILVKNNERSSAIDTFTSLALFEDAKNLILDEDSHNPDSKMPYILSKQAEWCRRTGRWRECVDILILNQEYEAASEVVSEHLGEGWVEIMMKIVDHIFSHHTQSSTSSPSTSSSIRPHPSKSLLTFIADVFITNGRHLEAREIYRRMNDISALMSLLIKQRAWTDV